MKRRRVKITGIGPVTPAGIGKEAFWKGILEPVSRVRPYTKLDEQYGPLVAAAIEKFDVGKYVERSKVPKGASRQSLFAVAGAALALADANLTHDEVHRARTVVITGSCVVDFGGIVNSIDAVQKKGPAAASPRVVYSSGIGSVPSAINHSLGFTGRTVALSNQCSSGLDAIGYAASLIATGEVDIAICGGTDAPLHRIPMLEFRVGEIISSTTELAERQARPFDLWRTAGAMGEGCAMLILEAESSPRQGYCYVSGYSFANDENGQLCGGMFDAAKMSLGQALLRPQEIDVLSAWGPGDKGVDRGEASAMLKLFGSRLSEIACSSIKGAIGSPLGAAPAIQVAAAALGQRFNAVPPTVNWEYPDPECPLNLSNRSRAIIHRHTLVNSHGLGSVNGALVLEKC